MSLSYRKRQLMRQAVNCYHEARKQSRDDWSKKMQGLMTKAGWDVHHPGSDKFSAIRGPLVVKWSGECVWSDTPIQWEMKVYRVLRKIGLGKHTPNVYLYKKDFIVEQNLGEDLVDYMDVDYACREFRFLVYKLGYDLIDCRPGNVRLIGKTLKIFDGRADWVGVPANEEKERKAA